MEFKKLANNTINFGINRIIEILGLGIIIAGVLLLISLASFSPNDPNFIFPDNTTIKNLLGFRGSFTSDLFFQSFGLIALLVPFSLIISGIKRGGVTLPLRHPSGCFAEHRSSLFPWDNDMPVQHRRDMAQIACRHFAAKESHSM